MNTNKYDLIDWSTVRDIKENKGLDVKDPFLLNLALGGHFFMEIGFNQNGMEKDCNS